MPDDNSNRRPAVVAAITASFIMLSFGLAYRTVAARLRGPTVMAPIAPDALEALPLQIADWMGQDVPVDETVINRTGTDAHVNRRYSRHTGSETISLYVACGVRVDEVIGHVPEGCYPAAGWTLVNHRLIDLSIKEGSKLPCSTFQCYRGELNVQKVAVLHYFVVDGQYCNEIPRLQSKVWRVLAAADYVAQVQIVASAENATVDSAVQLVSDFAIDSAPVIARVFEDLQVNRRTHESSNVPQGR